VWARYDVGTNPQTLQIDMFIHAKRVAKCISRIKMHAGFRRSKE